MDPLLISASIRATQTVTGCESDEDSLGSSRTGNAHPGILVVAAAYLFQALFLFLPTSCRIISACPGNFIRLLKEDFARPIMAMLFEESSLPWVGCWGSAGGLKIRMACPGGHAPQLLQCTLIYEHFLQPPSEIQALFIPFRHMKEMRVLSNSPQVTRLSSAAAQVIIIREVWERPAGNPLL